MEFWPLKTVIAKVGLSKSEVYRQMAAGLFPHSRGYRDNPKKRFWLSTDIVAWQQRQISSDFEELFG